MRGLFARFELNYGVAGLLLVAMVIVIGMIAGALTFGDLAGIGFVYAAGVGLVCAACAGGTKPTFCDSANIRNHWRGHVQVAAAIMFIGAVGAGASTLLS